LQNSVGVVTRMSSGPLNWSESVARTPALGPFASWHQ
jgi:hypothetical protein